MPTSDLRRARVGDHLPRRVVDRVHARRLEATALLQLGTGAADAYREALARQASDFAAWDGHVVEVPSDGLASHRLLVVDRYGQVYAVHESADAAALPAPTEIGEWFRFLATACPECGVLDQPILTGPTP